MSEGSPATPIRDIAQMLHYWALSALFPVPLSSLYLTILYNLTDRKDIQKTIKQKYYLYIYPFLAKLSYYPSKILAKLSVFIP